MPVLPGSIRFMLSTAPDPASRSPIGLMTTPEKDRYFDATTDRPVRDDLRFAVSLATGDRVAIDCGCGAGSDIAYLRSEDFVVHAFDVEADAIRRCTERFADDARVHLQRASFTGFDYPAASLIVADASLFYCPPQDSDDVWRRITDALVPGGVFAGSFLGPGDTMAGPDFDRDAFWPEVLVMTEDELRPRFGDFNILRWNEHRQSGETADGTPHDWHIYAVVAQKKGQGVSTSGRS